MGAQAVMSTGKPQAISGVSAGVETVAMNVWPSICATGAGRGIGRLSDSIPFKINGIKLSYLLLTPIAIPFALLFYFWLKVFGERYTLTNQAVERWSSLGTRRLARVSLDDLATVAIVGQPGQAFYHAADLELRDKAGNRLMTLAGVPRADVFRQTIIKARDARQQVAASLAKINARHA
jgi:hypothetical protein